MRSVFRAVLMVGVLGAGMATGPGNAAAPPAAAPAPRISIAQLKGEWQSSPSPDVVSIFDDKTWTNRFHGNVLGKTGKGFPYRLVDGDSLAKANATAGFKPGSTYMEANDDGELVYYEVVSVTADRLTLYNVKMKVMMPMVRLK